MALALQRPGPLDWAEIAPALGLDIAGARLAGKATPLPAMTGARLNADGLIVGGVLSQFPNREIVLLFPAGAVHDANVFQAPLGSDPRIERSNAGPGYAIVSLFGDVEGTVLVSASDNIIEGLTVRLKYAAAGKREPQ
jgi:hypothetical protein